MWVPKKSSKLYNITYDARLTRAKPTQVNFEDEFSGVRDYQEEKETATLRYSNLRDKSSSYGELAEEVESNSG